MSRPFQHRIRKQVEPRSGYGGWKPGHYMTHDFRDSDGDGIDDRKQPGPGVVPDYMKNRPPIKRPPMGGGGRPPRGGGWSPKPPRRGKTVKGSRPRPPMPSPKPPRRGGTIGGAIGVIGGAIGGRPPRGGRPPMFGGGRPTRPPRGGGRPPMFGGGRPTRPPRKGRTVKGSRPRPPMPSPKPPMGGAWDPPNAHGGERRYSL